MNFFHSNLQNNLKSAKNLPVNMTSVELSIELLDINIMDLLFESQLVTSKSEARRLIEQNGVSLNQEKINLKRHF